jgi:hypothetical protein
VQIQAKTGRKEKEINAEVARGYAEVRQLLSAQLEKHPGDWRLLMERAALRCDENVFLNEAQRDSAFATRRNEAFADFQAATAAYAKALPGLEDKDQSVDVFTTWFYASLGASDLANVRAEQVASPQQIPLIREAITSLGGEAAEKHETQFANALATRISAVPPAAKQRYVEMGLTIAGDNERAKAVHETAEFYRDIVKEIALEVTVDCGRAVGTEPFGVWVDIRHTPEIERAAGGFQRYLVNQNNQPMFWNFGRPPENYRDKFSEAAKEALSESFEIQSITFHNEKVPSRPAADPGWRITPYAYLLLKSKGPQVDAIPPLTLSLDFTETGGYVILPVSSSRLPIASNEPPAASGPTRLEITQTLDERKLSEGKVTLEIQATAEGLIPPLAGLIGTDFGDFALRDIDDQGLQINELRVEDDAPPKVLTSRTGVAKLERKPGAGSVFRLPNPSGVQTTSYRYAGNDLAEVRGDVPLGPAQPTAPAWLIGALLALGLGVVGLLAFLRHKHRRPAATAPDHPSIPDALTPLSLVRFLRQIHTSPNLDGDARKALEAEIAQVESRCYAPQGDIPASVNLRAIAESWANRASA